MSQLIEGVFVDTDGNQRRLAVAVDENGQVKIVGTLDVEVPAPAGGATEAKQDALIALVPAALTAAGNFKVSIEEGGGDSTVPARTPTTTSVASSASSVTLLASNANRRGISIANLSTQFLYLSFATPATTANCFMRLDPGMFMLLDQQMIVTGAIYGIWAAANGTAQVTEYV